MVVLEGLWPLHRARIRKLFDYRIFLDCPARRRFERRLARDVAETVRASVSRGLRNSSRLPHDLARKLADDVDAVALPLLEAMAPLSLVVAEPADFCLQALALTSNPPSNTKAKN